MARKSTEGFGYLPAENGHHFLIIEGKKKDEPVAVYELLTAKEEPDTEGLTNCKVLISKEKWKLCKARLQTEFNLVLKAENKKVGQFKQGAVPLELALGKELLLLLWAIEDAAMETVLRGIENWLGFSREERWWLYTLTNAQSGKLEQKVGWRIALRYALTENPKPAPLPKKEAAKSKAKSKKQPKNLIELAL